MTSSIYDFKAQAINGEEVSLSNWKGKVLLIVNVASRCGFTNQYEGLQELFAKYKDKDFSVLAFPCNQFGAQESGTDEEIKTFCETTFNISFPMFSKVDVNGADAHPLFTYLKEQKPGALGTKGIKWNFTKFLIDKDGKPVERYAPQDKPENLVSDIEKYL